jgi:hypothetical protein
MNKEEYKRQNEQRDKRRNAKLFDERAVQERLEDSRGWRSQIGSWFEWWRVPSDRFAALIALFTAVLSVVAYFQLTAMRSTDEATHTAAEAAKRAADISAVANRAWISPLVAKLTEPLDENKPFVAITITTQNVGREPALGAVTAG